MDQTLILSSRRKQVYLLVANTLFLVHLFAILSNVFGWLIPGFFYVYFAILIASIISEVYFGFCILTRLEFGLRKKIDPGRIFHSSCIKYYAFKFFKIGKPAEAASRPIQKRSSAFLILLLSLLSVGLIYKFIILQLLT